MVGIDFDGEGSNVQPLELPAQIGIVVLHDDQGWVHREDLLQRRGEIPPYFGEGLRPGRKIAVFGIGDDLIPGPQSKKDLVDRGGEGDDAFRAPCADRQHDPQKELQ